MTAPEPFSILLVDHDPTVIRVLNRILCGFAPLRAATCASGALKLAREAPPDLMLLDVNLPDSSGFELCRRFKEDPQLAAVPILFLSSEVSPEVDAVGLELGAADFIRKPPYPALVLARVRTYQQLKTLSDTLSGTMRNAVTIDFLTGALARRQFEKLLIKEWIRAGLTGEPLALLIGDIGDFAAYNAAYGEERGDECLKAVAQALRTCAQRPTDLLGRHAGGQFALLLPDTDLPGARIVAQRAVDAVDALQILQSPSLGRSGRVTLSVGGAGRRRSATPGEPDELGSPPKAIFAAAEAALEDARQAGGHRAELTEHAITVVDLAPLRARSAAKGTLSA